MNNQTMKNQSLLQMYEQKELKLQKEFDEMRLRLELQNEFDELRLELRLRLEAKMELRLEMLKLKILNLRLSLLEKELHRQMQ